MSSASPATPSLVTVTGGFAGTRTGSFPQVRPPGYFSPDADPAAVKAFYEANGYLVLENGIFIFGLLLVEAMPFLVEIGVLLDLFVAIFVMGIIIYQISQEFSTVSTRKLSALKE